MAEVAQMELVPASLVAQQTPVRQAENRLCYAIFADTHITEQELEPIVQAVPNTIAAALTRHAYYFVPLTIGETEETMVAPGYTIDLGDRAMCHRNVQFDGSDCIFISTRLMQDRFALAFEFFINVGHHFVEAVGVPQSFCDLAWSQALADVRGETSQDSYESRRRALDRGRNALSPAWISRSQAEVWKRAGSTSGRRAASLNPRSLMRWPFICSRSRLTSTTRICGSASIRCWPRQRWRSGCAMWPGSFHLTLAMIFKSPIAISSNGRISA
jgi:hypothetical protein